MKKPSTSRAKAAEPVLAVSGVAEWSTWLRANHAKVRGVLLRIPRRAAETGITYAEALDVALAWGWIDSQKRPLDASAWLQRFTPRTSKSPWSKVNRAKAEALMRAGTMEAPGLAEVERAKSDGRWESAYDGARTAGVPADLEAALARNARARAFFETLDSANRFAILYRVQAAKKPQTRSERIEKFVGMCTRHETIHPARAKKPAATSRRPR